MRWSFFFLIILTSIAVLTGNTVSSAEVNPSGEINQSVVFDQDMFFTGSGLTVTANDIIIDCQFYAIKGDGSGNGISFFNNNNVTVRNCKVDNFITGLDVDNSFVILNASLITNNSEGIVIRGSSSLDTDNNSIKNNTANLQNANPSITISAKNNWWGSNFSDEIRNKIAGNVIFEPFLAIDPYSDDDKDGIPLLRDNCPAEYNLDQLDRDADGKGDACDINLFIRGFVFDPAKEAPRIPVELLATVETGYYVVQYESGKGSDVVSNITSLNGKNFGFITGNGLLVYVNASRNVLERIPGIRFIDIYQPAFKVDPELFDMINSGIMNSSENITLKILVFKNKVSVKTQLENYGTVQEFSSEDPDFSNSILITLPRSAVVGITLIPDIRSVDILHPKQNEMNIAVGITGVRNIRSSLGLTGKNQIITIYDDGIDRNHPDLKNRIVQIMYSPPLEMHGTHTSGIAVGDGNASGGVIRGVAYEAGLIFQYNENVTISINRALSDAYGLGSRVTSNSWGAGGGAQYRAEDGDYDNFTRNNPEMLAVKSAGNSGPADKTITSPGVSKNILTVANSENERPEDDTDADNRDQLETTSSNGFTRDGRIKPDVAAPGTWILAPLAAGIQTDACDANRNGVFAELLFPNANYTFCTGTSMAAPHVAGMSILIREFLSKFKGYNDPTGTLIKAFIINGARNMADGGILKDIGNNRGTVTIPNSDEGWGRVNLTKSIFPSNRLTGVIFLDNKTGFNGNNQHFNLTFIRFSSDKELSITLAWYDLVDAGMAGTLVNDLDLILTSPSGAVYLGGNRSFANGISLPGRARDNVNNVERLFITPPEDGFYNISVQASNIAPGTNQPFAIVFSEVLGVDSANKTGNYTYYFPAGSKIYAQAVGLPGDLDVEIFTLAHKKDFLWDQDISINEANGFTLLNSFFTTTTSDGNFTDETLIWDTTGKEKEIFESNGTFNILVKFPEDGVYFENFVKGKDVIDYHAKVGFRVAVVNSSREDSVFEDKFTYVSRVFVKGVGFEPGKKVTVSVVKDRIWSDRDHIWSDAGIMSDEVARISDIRIGDDGFLNAFIWSPRTGAEVGKYDIFVDVNGNGNYDREFDVVDGLSNTGFEVVCRESDVACGSVASAFSTGTETNIFSKDNPAYAKIGIFKKNGVKVNAYVVKSPGAVEDLHGSPLIDHSGGAEAIAIDPDGHLISINQIWPSTKEGHYEIILDVDGDGIFNKSVDIYDPDGFIVSRDIEQPRIAVDSKGNLHMVTLERGKDGSGYDFTNVLYRKVPLENGAKIDIKDPELFNWSEDQAVDLKVVATIPGFKRVNDPDIAIDSKDEPHLIYSRKVSEFEWLVHTKLNSKGSPDTCYERPNPDRECGAELGENPTTGQKIYNWGKYSEILVYYLGGDADFKLDKPKIAIDPVSNQPVISARVSLTYPDKDYFDFTYPRCYNQQTAPQAWYYNIPIFGEPQLFEPIQFQGDSIQIARRMPGSPVYSPQWPFSLGFEGYNKYSAARQEHDACLSNTATALPIRDKNWKWITADEGYKSTLDLFDSDIDVDSSGDAHVVYNSKERISDPVAPERLFYNKIVGLFTDSKLMISDNSPGFFSMDVDSEKTVHTVWQSGNEINYNKIDHSGSAGEQKIIASLRAGDISSPSISVDTDNDPHIVWNEKDENRLDILKYIKGKNSAGEITFPDHEIDIVNSSSTKRMIYPVIDTNKLAKDNDWEDKIYVAWFEYSDKASIKFKRTTPHVVALVVIDGLDDEFLATNMGVMTNLQKLLDEHPGIEGTTFSSSPSTTMSSQAELFTGLKPGKNHVIGDNFQGFDAKVYEVNDIHSGRTIFEFLGDAGRSKSAIPSIFINGIATERPDHMVQARMTVLTDVDRDYLANLDNNDGIKDNDVADLVVAYILTHDHGITTNPDPGEIDANIGYLIDAFKEHQIFNDTTFIFTSDHGFADVVKDDEHSLDNSDIPDLPDGPINPLHLNGKFAYSYDGIEVAKRLYNNSKNRESEWFGKIDRILVKDHGVYNDYSSGSTGDVLAPAFDYFLGDLLFPDSPNIILIAGEGYYFEEPHVAIFNRSLLPFIVAGKGYSLFSRGNNNLPFEIPMVDVGPTVAFFTGGKRVVDRMTGIDGKNVFDPELTIEGGSPVNLHLYDSQGRHTGVDEFGNMEYEIPGSHYEIDDTTGKKRITLLQAPDDYRVEVESFGYGAFGLSVKLNRRGESFEINYPRTYISPSSLARINLRDTFDIELDFDGDSTFEKRIDPSKLVTIEQDERNNTATASLIRVPSGESINIDAIRSTETELAIKTINPVNNGVLTVTEIFNSSLDSLDFYTPGSYIQLDISSNILASSGEIKLTISYSDNTLIQRSLSERSLSLYDMDSGIKLNSTIDPDMNRISAVIDRSGNYVLASNDLEPKIENITVEPQITGIVRAAVKITARITDNGAITSSTVTLGNATEQLIFNPATGLCENTLTGPETSGRYQVIIEAEDDNNNTATQRSYFILDKTPPEITIISPENTSYITNRINLSYYVNERSNTGYSVDGGPEIAVNNTKPFTINYIPLILSGGSHSITISATDEYENTAAKSVRFSIESQNIRVTDLKVPLFEKPDKTIQVKARVTNTLIENVGNVEVQFLVNDIVNDNRFLNISGETGQDVIFSFTRGQGRYNVSIRSVPLTEERFVDDNILTKEILITNKVPLLLVNDASGVNDSVYREAIIAAGGPGYDFILYDERSRGPPSLELMSKFPAIIWFTGGGSTLSPVERGMLKSYLDNRGKLLIFGNDLGRDIGGTDLYKNYLFAEFRRQSPTLSIEGGFRDIIGNGFLFSITEPGEEIKPVLPGTESFRYSGGESAGIKVDNGLFKTVYFAFGLEDIPDQETRNRIIDRVLGFFGLDITPPVIINKDPANGSTFPKNTNSLTLSLQTNEIAECRLSNMTNVFGEMPGFISTGTLSHSTSVTNLVNGETYTFFINCKDMYGNYNNTESFNFAIYNRTFLPPFIESIADIIVFEDEMVTFSVNATDPENDPLIIGLSDRETSGYVPIASRFSLLDRTFNLRTTFDDSGSYDLRVSVSDGFETVTEDLTLTVINVNRPPSLETVGNKILLENNFFSYDVNASDPDGDDLTFSDNTTLFDINPFSGKISFTSKYFQVGDHYVNISVTDGELSDNEVVLFRITNTNNPPVIDMIMPQTARAGELFILRINATDNDGDTLTFSDDTNLFDISPDGLISFTPSNTDAGTYFINISVTDGLVSSTRILNLLIVQDDHLPIITGLTYPLYVFINQTFEINLTACVPYLDPECG